MSSSLVGTTENEVHLFPVLTPAQVERAAAAGRVRKVESGEVLLEQGDKSLHIFVIRTGAIEIVRPTGTTGTLIKALGPGQFTGEATMISGRRALVRIRVSESGELIELDRERVLGLIQTDSELSEILMRAFILRRVELIARGFGDLVLVGSVHSAGTLRIKEFLTRNGHPYAYVDLERDADVESMLTRFNVSAADIPVVICRGKAALRNPSNRELADCLGFNDTIDRTHIRDLVVVGAGPSGLAAAVYGASEGLDVLVLETALPGGQAGSSSRIENYLGFPLGISGQELASRAYAQAQKFGAQVLVTKPATRLHCDRKPYSVEIEDGIRIATRAVVIATGAEYRKLTLQNLSRFEGAGIYYGATTIESQLCGGQEVIVVGGGNSAGQAAVFLAQTALRVFILVRSSGLADTMSRYLIRRIEETPNIVLLPHTEIVSLQGNDHLESLEWRNSQTGTTEKHSIQHVFMMTGAVPNTDWLEGCLVRDVKGFVKTGADLSREELTAANWPLARAPYLLETSLPGVFAVGDVRGGSVKRVASAVGEGSITISYVHQFLQG